MDFGTFDLLTYEEEQAFEEWCEEQIKDSACGDYNEDYDEGAWW